MLLAEDLLLLLTHDVSGRHVCDTTRLDLVLAGAVMRELAEAGRVGVAIPGEAVKAGRLVVRAPAPTGDPVLDEALRTITLARPKTPQNHLRDIAKGLRPHLLAGLVGQGLLRRQEHRVLGLFTRRTWPAIASGHTDQVRAGLHDVLVTGRTAAPRELALISLLHAMDRVPQALGEVGVPPREIRRRAKALAQDGFVEQAVRKAISAANDASAAAFAG